MKVYTCDICECEWAEQEDGLLFGGKFSWLDPYSGKTTFDLCTVCAGEIAEIIKEKYTEQLSV